MGALATGEAVRTSCSSGGPEESVVCDKVADLAAIAFAGGSPTRSEAQSNGALRRSAMRTVALDLGVKKICFSEVRNQQASRIAVERKERNPDEMNPCLSQDAAT